MSLGETRSQTTWIGGLNSADLKRCFRSDLPLLLLSQYVELFTLLHNVSEYFHIIFPLYLGFMVLYKENLEWLDLRLW